MPTPGRKLLTPGRQAAISCSKRCQGGGALPISTTARLDVQPAPPPWPRGLRVPLRRQAGAQSKDGVHGVGEGAPGPSASGRRLPWRCRLKDHGAGRQGVPCRLDNAPGLKRKRWARVRSPGCCEPAAPARPGCTHRGRSARHWRMCPHAFVKIRVIHGRPLMRSILLGN